MTRLYFVFTSPTVASRNSSSSSGSNSSDTHSTSPPHSACHRIDEHFDTFSAVALQRSLKMLIEALKVYKFAFDLIMQNENETLC